MYHEQVSSSYCEVQALYTTEIWQFDITRMAKHQTTCIQTNFSIVNTPILKLSYMHIVNQVSSLGHHQCQRSSLGWCLGYMVRLRV